LPPKPAYLRVKIWRRLQALGSVPIKNSVYVLPNTESAREDFAWLLREIQQERGEASLCEARLVDGLTDDDVRASFQTARETDYRSLATDVRRLAHEFPRRRDRPFAPAQRAGLEAGLSRLRKRLAEIAKIDFFGASGRESVEGLLRGLDDRLGDEPSNATRARGGQRSASEAHGRTWVTREGVHVDRMASAWLIKRFLDREATFKFVQNRGYEPAVGELRFDMFEAEFTHDGDLCTFEVLLRDFAVDDPALRPIAEIIHDIDLKETKFERAELAGVDHLIVGIAATHPEDDARIAHASAVFDGLYGYFRRKKDR
jgi:hypothetical protein